MAIKSFRHHDDRVQVNVIPAFSEPAWSGRAGRKDGPTTRGLDMGNCGHGETGVSPKTAFWAVATSTKPASAWCSGTDDRLQGGGRRQRRAPQFTAGEGAGRRLAPRTHFPLFPPCLVCHSVPASQGGSAGRRNCMQLTVRLAVRGDWTRSSAGGTGHRVPENVRLRTLQPPRDLTLRE